MRCVLCLRWYAETSVLRCSNLNWALCFIDLHKMLEWCTKYSISEPIMKLKLRLLATCLFCIAALPSNAEGLREKYQSFNDSFTNASLEFSCGSATYKLTKKIFKSPKLYFKDGLDWHELRDLEIKDTGIRFSGTGLTGDLPLSLLTFKENVPIFNTSHRKYQSKYDFYKDITKNKFVPMSSEIDFYSGKLKQENSQPIIRLLEFNANEYISTQSKLNKNYFSSSNISVELMMEEVEIKILKERISKLEEFGEHIPTFYEAELKEKRKELVEAQSKVDSIHSKELLKRQQEELQVQNRINDVNQVVNNTPVSVMAMAGLGVYKNSQYCYPLE